MAARVLTSDSRSAVLALLCAALWLGFGGRRALLKFLVFGGLAGALVLFCFSLAAGKRWEETALRNAYEKAVSLTDFSGRRDYYGEGSSSKGDNNRFRAVWWKSILAETYQKNPYIGLGFGYDLADEFLKTYYPEGNDEFNVRSPHNIFVTLFARTGAVGLLAFLCFLAANGLATLRATRQREKPEEALPWCCGWAILASACFGVVLEGPMGAVPYWIFLGIGSAALIKREYEPASPMPAEGKAIAS
jgi:O-antigen ligase